MMSLSLPEDIPVAAESLDAIFETWPNSFFPKNSQCSLVSLTDDSADPCIVWAAIRLSKTREIWQAASEMGCVNDISDWGESIDIDHVFPRSWARVLGAKVQFVRLYPVMAKVNRSAGAGREKSALRDGITATSKHGIFYANELQVLKIIGHEVVTAGSPVKIFE